MEFLIAVLAFVVAIGVLVTVHEFGHYWVARRAGVKVLKFSVGFGKPLWSRRAGADGTEYAIGTVPLGGYVQMLDERVTEVDPAESGRAFNNKPLRWRTAIVLAGPAANFLFAIVAYWLVAVIGVTGLKPIIGEVTADSLADQAGLEPGQEIVQVEERVTPTWQVAVQSLLNPALQGRDAALQLLDPEGREVVRTIPFGAVDRGLFDEGDLLANIGITPARPTVEPVLDHIQPDSPAAQAGLEPGDRLVAADGRAIGDWSEWVAYVQERPDEPIEVSLLRDSERLEVTLVPAAVETSAGETGQIGASVRIPEEAFEAYQTRARHGPLEAVGVALQRTWEMTTLSLRMGAAMITGRASLENLSGPIGIAQFAGQTATIGLVTFLMFLALVSLSLGIINLLPIPMLDGGHLMYFAVEWVKGSPVSEQAQLIGQQVGLFLIFLLIAFAIYNDLARILG